MVRRALAMATGEQYFRLALGFASIAAISRLLTPAEIGISVIGTSIMLIALGLREFATPDFLIQREEVVQDDVKASFTVLFLFSLLISAALCVLAPWFGTFYGEEKLARFLQVAAIAALVESISGPTRGLLRREMAFGTLALINTTSAVVTAGTTVLLAFGGFSFMSVAWAMLAAALVTTVLSFVFRPDFAILRPTFRHWDRVLSFGGYNGVSFVINRTYEALPQLILGRILPPAAVGLYNRATMVSDIPDKIILTSVLSVAFPALAAELRQGRDLKQPYLKALSYITVFYWPGQVMLVLLAFPIVWLLLGPQWEGVVPILQVMAIATFAWFPVVLTSPILLAVGANRDRVLAEFVGRSVSAVVLCSAAGFGVMAMAASKLVTLPFQMVLSLCFVRRHVFFEWRELHSALWKSALATAGSAAGPLCVLLLSGQGFNLSLGAAAMAALLAGLGWLAAIVLTQHPVLLEFRRAGDQVVAGAVIRSLGWRRSVREPPNLA